MTSRLALHMVEALPLRSVWIGKSPRPRPPLVRWWMKGALLAIGSAVLITGCAVLVVKILRAAL